MAAYNARRVEHENERHELNKEEIIAGFLHNFLDTIWFGKIDPNRAQVLAQEASPKTLYAAAIAANFH